MLETCHHQGDPVSDQPQLRMLPARPNDRYLSLKKTYQHICQTWIPFSLPCATTMIIIKRAMPAQPQGKLLSWRLSQLRLSYHGYNATRRERTRDQVAVQGTLVAKLTSCATTAIRRVTSQGSVHSRKRTPIFVIDGVIPRQDADSNSDNNININRSNCHQLLHQLCTAMAN